MRFGTFQFPSESPSCLPSPKLPLALSTRHLQTALLDKWFHAANSRIVNAHSFIGQDATALNVEAAPKLYEHHTTLVDHACFARLKRFGVVGSIRTSGFGSGRALERPGRFLAVSMEDGPKVSIVLKARLLVTRHGPCLAA